MSGSLVALADDDQFGRRGPCRAPWPRCAPSRPKSFTGTSRPTAMARGVGYLAPPGLNPVIHAGGDHRDVLAQGSPGRPSPPPRSVTASRSAGSGRAEDRCAPRAPPLPGRSGRAGSCATSVRGCGAARSCEGRGATSARRRACRSRSPRVRRTSVAVGSLRHAPSEGTPSSGCLGVLTRYPSLAASGGRPTAKEVRMVTSMPD